ncbi:hypothetical protein IU462_29825 [Nocardia farcinica]|uniref:hypothetical protein n=1 Tax=Nocardia farcinica TaxID=37329 RepID=UPI0018945175|nr:hypothetical protein [Nocardia farcinica]MBF6309072.1 hypothetical protein [Nocardia farcinica]
MQIHLPLLLTGTIALGELELFIKTARDLGATAETEIEVRALENYADVLDGLFFDSESLKASTTPATAES